MTTAADLSATLQTALGPQYRLERELGRGGMGVVYLATDLALERSVAVKVISPELAVNRTLADRFIAEARLIAKVRHPGIVTVYNAGTADGLLYYVMDHVPGETLRDLLQREGRLDVEVATALAADLASALDAAARAGVVHRDVKPENILVERGGGGWRALLADFGIACVMQGDDRITGPGVAMGTPVYMSPEQAAGDAVDARSDIYSLGVVAFEMLAGRPPFEGDRRTIVSRALIEAPPDLQQIRSEVPAHVAGAIERALEKVPEQRWQSGESFRRALSGEVEVARMARPRRRRPGMIAAAVALVAVLAATAWGALRPDGPPTGVNPRHSFLILPFGNMKDDEAIAWLAPGSVSMLDLALSQWRELTVVSHERVHDLLEDAEIPEGTMIGLDEGRRMARRAGAWTLVVGEFERTRDSLHLVARAFDVTSGQRLELAEVWGHLGDDVRPMFDELATKLLDLSGAPAGASAPLASVTTSSLEAYRAYLRGLEELNLWNLGDAERLFREATAVDSTFGLAFFRLALTRGWRSSARDTLSERYLARATQYSAGLPDREQQMIEAYRALTEGRYPEAQTLYAELTRRDSLDAEAWYGLGDAFFHDLSNSQRAQVMTQSLNAFRRTLDLDPRYGLAYDHVNWMLTQAAVEQPYFALMSGDRFVRTRNTAGTSTLGSDLLATAVRRARGEAVAMARAWTEYQPGTFRAHRALYEAHLASGDIPSALAVAVQLRSVLPEGARPLAAFLEARARLLQGDAITAEQVLTQALENFDPLALGADGLGQEVITDVLSGANVLAYRGNLGAAASVIRAADQLRRLVLPPGAIIDAYGDERVWESARLAALYSAVGVPPYELRELWRRVARAAEGATQRERPVLAWAGASAAQGLLVGPGDASALSELEQLTGVPPRPEFQALARITQGDTAAAESTMAVAERQTRTPATTAEKPDEPMLHQSAAFAMGDPRPVAAEVHFLLGNYQRTIDLLEGFQPERLGSRTFDARWGLLPRIRLLRGLAYEKLGQPEAANRELTEVVAMWEGADGRLAEVVNTARQALARLGDVREKG